MLNIKNVLFIVIAFSVISCTQTKDSAQSEQKSDRSIASYGKKRQRRGTKKVNIQRKGFYITHKSLAPLSTEEKIGYYRVFGNASSQFERLIKKSKYSQNFDFLKEFDELMFPRAEAVACPSAFWVMDNGQSTCTRDNSFYDPTTSPQWRTYGPVGGLLSTVNACRSRGQNAFPCPPLALETSNGQATLRCAVNGNSHECDNRASFANTVRLLDECERGGRLSVENVTCADLQTSVRRAVQMFNDNCSRPPNGRMESSFRTICGNIQTAVNQVAQRIGERVNPMSAEYLPTSDPSCLELGGRVQSERQGESASSPHWRALLQIASTNCSNARGIDPAELENRFGACTQTMRGGDQATLDRLVQNFGQGRNSPTYTMEFMKTFGMAPSRYENAFCNNTGFPQFQEHINTRLPDDVYQSEVLLINRLASSDMPSGTNINEWQAMREWFNQNRTVLEGMSSDPEVIRNNVIEARDNLQSTASRDAMSIINESLEALRRGASVDLGSALNSRIQSAGYTNTNQQMAMRAALFSRLRLQIIGGENVRAVNRGRQFMEACRDEIGSQRNSRAAEVDGQTGTFTPDRPNECNYVRVSDLS